MAVLLFVVQLIHDNFTIIRKNTLFFSDCREKSGEIFLLFAGINHDIFLFVYFLLY